MSEQDPSQDLITPPAPEEYAEKRLASDAKIQANRKNALRSTGPKTERGKRIASRNALTHGFLAQQVVITAGDGQENVEQFDELVAQLTDYYNPVGVVEQTLVQNITATLWRKARVIRAENGEIRKRLDTLTRDRADRDLQRANLNLAITLSCLDWGNRLPALSMSDRSAMQVIQSNLQENATTLEFLSELLRTAKNQIASDGCISETIRNRIYSAFSFCDYRLAMNCYNATTSKDRKQEGPSKECTTKKSEQDTTFVVSLIDDQLEKLNASKKYVVEREKLAVDAETRSLSLPSTDASERLIRYEAHLDRQLYRAMDQLERLQRKREGESVPPPLNVNLGRRT